MYACPFYKGLQNKELEDKNEKKTVTGYYFSSAIGNDFTDYVITIFYILARVWLAGFLFL